MSAIAAAGRLLLAILTPSLIALGLAALVAPLLYLGSTDTESVQKEINVPVTKPIDRVALVALHRAGMAALNDVTDEEGEVTGTEWWPIDANPIVACGDDPVVEALAATEAYLRPAWRRNLEIGLARLSNDLFGFYPDWSYGIGQVRIATARRAIEAAGARVPPGFGALGPADLSDDAIFEMLAQPCDNLRVMRLVVADGGKPGETVREIADRYRGGASLPVVPGVVSYPEVVARIATARTLVDGGYSLNAGVVPEGGEAEIFEDDGPDVLVWSIDPTGGGTPVACLDGSAPSEGSRRIANAFAPLAPEVPVGEAVEVPAAPLAGFLAAIDRPASRLTVSLWSDSFETWEASPLVALQEAGTLSGALTAVGLDPAGGWAAVSLGATEDADPALVDCGVGIAISPPPAGYYAALAGHVRAVLGASSAEAGPMIEGP